MQGLARSLLTRAGLPARIMPAASGAGPGVSGPRACSKDHANRPGTGPATLSKDHARRAWGGGAVGAAWGRGWAAGGRIEPVGGGPPRAHAQEKTKSLIIRNI